MNSFPHGPVFAPFYPQRQSQDTLVAAQVSVSQMKSPLSQGPLAVLAPKPTTLDFTGTVPMQFGHTFQGKTIASVPAPQILSPIMYIPPNQPTIPSPSVPAIGPQHSGPGDFYGVSPSPRPFDPAPSLETASPLSRARYRGSMSEPDEPSGFAVSGHLHPSGGKSPVGYWQSDDEASMVDSDEEQLPDTHLALESNDLGIQVVDRLENTWDLNGTRLRSFITPLVDDILDTYTPSSANSPLNDPQTAAIFWYFVNMTGPSMSLYERHPFDPSPMFQGGPVPKARRHIWTCKSLHVLARPA